MFCVVFSFVGAQEKSRPHFVNSIFVDVLKLWLLFGIPSHFGNPVDLSRDLNDARDGPKGARGGRSCAPPPFPLDLDPPGLFAHCF